MTEAPASFPDLELPDHTGRPRTLSELADGDPVALFFSRGWWCPKEQRYFRGLVELQDEFEVAYSRLVAVSVDPPEVQSAFRAGLGARFTFLSDHGRHYLDELGLRETTDTVHNPYRPTAFTLESLPGGREPDAEGDDGEAARAASPQGAAGRRQRFFGRPKTKTLSP